MQKVLISFLWLVDQGCAAFNLFLEPFEDRTFLLQILRSVGGRSLVLVWIFIIFYVNIFCTAF